MSDDQLLDELLAKPVGPAIKGRSPESEDFTNKIEVNGDTLSVTLRDESGVINEGRALRYIEDEGQDPSKWEVYSWYKVEYGPISPLTGKPTMESVRFTFKRRQDARIEALSDSQLLGVLDGYAAPIVLPTGSHGFLVLIGDMQFGKIDGDGPAGTLKRTIACIDKAAQWLDLYRRIFDIGHVHVAWLGDHIEGFVSQNGGNAWRTQLALNEQIRLTRRVMLHSLVTFAPLAQKVTFAAVPGNHGEAVRFEGTGTTRYDDSHDTEALIAVADAAEMMPEKFGHVEFFVPNTDELTVVTEVAGTVLAHAHGHKFGTAKKSYFDWWEGQAFNRASAMHVADVLVAGHSHHELVDTDGDRTFIQTPAMESESTWFRHHKGTGGAPGLMVAITKGGRVPIKHMIESN